MTPGGAFVRDTILGASFSVLQSLTENRDRVFWDILYCFDTQTFGDYGAIKCIK